MRNVIETGKYQQEQQNTHKYHAFFSEAESCIARLPFFHAAKVSKSLYFFAEDQSMFAGIQGSGKNSVVSAVF